MQKSSRKVSPSYKFVVIGAGPSGILIMEKLLSTFKGSQNEILWIDPHFKVGDLGRKWPHVPSNTKVKTFIDVLKKFSLYKETFFQDSFSLFKHDPEEICYLKDIVDPLQWITDQLAKRVHLMEDFVESLEYTKGQWYVRLADKQVFLAKNVFLTHGADPITLSQDKDKGIPLEVALHKEQLNLYLNEEDVVGVFGSSHSAVLVLKNLIELNKAKTIYNFYRSPLRYAIYLSTGEILFDNTGLKGVAAEFSKEYLENCKESKIVRINSSQEDITPYIDSCTKIIDAVGFERRKIRISNINIDKYDEKTGIIAKGLFGLGIAFPSHVINHLGELEKNIGIRKFALHLESIFPIWVKSF